MNYFDNYTSNTLAGSGNQFFYINDDTKKVTACRILYKVFCGGEYDYSFLFSNIIDSTFADGSESHMNMIIDSWDIHKIRAGVTDFCDESAVKEPFVMMDVTIDGKCSKKVNPGEFFSTDSISIKAKANEYICLEILFSGKTIPYHEESIIPSFIYENDTWIPSKKHPFASMVGCNRKVKARIAFLGDSITQGIGTGINSYKHWNSIVADNIGYEYSYWNLGIGYGRADDAASDGAWLFKAKQNDAVVVCFGVNDILNNYSEEAIKNNLNTIVSVLKNHKIKLILQTIPPFDYHDEQILLWNNLNDYIKNELSKKADMVFDCTHILSEDASMPYMAKYGGHPNEEGCRLWGEALSKTILSCLNKWF